MAGGKAATKSSPKNISQKKDESASEIGENELRIEDRIYTISEEFARKHPGGTVIKSKLGSNATQAFHEFHYRTEAKARKWLARLKSREATTKQDPFLDDFDNLRKQLIAEGYFEPSYAHVAYRIIEILLMTVVGYKLVVAGWWWTGMVLLGLMSGRCGWLQHEANHNSLTGNVAVDRIIGSFVFSMGEAGSALWWIRSHNRHHASPQHVGYDADLNTLPVLAFDRIHASMGNPKWLRYQMFWFVPSTWLVVLYWKLYLHPLSIVQKKAWTDGLFLVLHYLVWYRYFSFLGLGGMIFAHFVWGSVEGTYLFVNFALSHTHKEVISKEESEDWVRSAILRTVNVRPNLLVNWWMGFLNLQIEHHLFPQMPQFRQPQVSARVRAFATKHGLDYDERGYFETLYATFNNLDTVGREALEELRSQKHK